MAVLTLDTALDLVFDTIGVLDIDSPFDPDLTAFLRERLMSDLDGYREHRQKMVGGPDEENSRCRACGGWKWCEDSERYGNALAEICLLVTARQSAS